MKPLTFLAGACCLLLLTSCNPFKTLPRGEAGVTEFHTRFNNEAYDEIYDQSHPDFQASETREDVVEFISNTRRQLGRLNSASRTSFSSNFENGASRIELTFDTTYDNGSGTETFLFQIERGVPLLLNWNIDADFGNGTAASTDNSSAEPDQNPAPQAEGSDSAVLEAVRAATNLFHNRFNAREFDAIYDTADPRFREAQSRQEVVSFIQDMRRQLGSNTNSALDQWVSEGEDGSPLVTLDYNMRYENGTGVEKFIFDFNDGYPLLLSWNIDGNLSGPAPQGGNPPSLPPVADDNGSEDGIGNSVK
ncbi:MAG: hypothetical protein AAF236_15875 [Verrucomicrobiota bacterium]